MSHFRSQTSGLVCSPRCGEGLLWCHLQCPVRPLNTLRAPYVLQPHTYFHSSLRVEIASGSCCFILPVTSISWEGSSRPLGATLHITTEKQDAIAFHTLRAWCTFAVERARFFDELSVAHRCFPSLPMRTRLQWCLSSRTPPPA